MQQVCEKAVSCAFVRRPDVITPCSEELDTSVVRTNNKYRPVYINCCNVRRGEDGGRQRFFRGHLMDRLSDDKSIHALEAAFDQQVGILI